MSETTIVRVQTGVRLEASMLNVLKALAALKGMTLGDLIEGVVLHAFEGESAFSAETLSQIRELRLRASDSHTLVESSQPRRAGAKRRRKS